MNIFLDTNIVLDMILPNRERKESIKQKVQDFGNNHSEINFFVSAKSVADIYYISRKYLLKCEVDYAIEDFVILDSTSKACNFAILSTDKNDDVEDIMQIICCNENKINLFMTADPKLIEIYGRLFNPKTKIELIQ
jgi:PIN domain nuclease of toxin-antitoxin system